MTELAQAWDEGMVAARARWMQDDDNEEYPPVNPYRAAPATAMQLQPVFPGLPEDEPEWVSDDPHPAPEADTRTMANELALYDEIRRLEQAGYPVDGLKRLLVARRSQPVSYTVSAEQRLALARVFAAARSGAENVPFYESNGSGLWDMALREADTGLAVLGITVEVSREED